MINHRNPAYGRNEKLDNFAFTQPSEIICFICDETVMGKGVPLLMTYTPYSNTDLPTKIGQLMGDGFMVIVAVTDVLCKRCTSLINYLDKLECDSSKVRTALTEFLKIKYQLDDESDTEQRNVQGSDTIPPRGGNENQFGDGCEEDSEKFQCFGTKALVADESTDDLKYNFISQGIKTENLKLEDNSSISDVKIIVVNSEELHDKCNEKYENSLTKGQYEMLEADNSYEYVEMVDGSVSAETIYECNACSFSTPVLDILLEHFQSHSEQDLHKCPECCQMFESQLEMECHSKQVHGASETQYSEDTRELENDPDYYPTTQKMYECHICKYHHNNKKVFDVHMRKHSKYEKFQCKKCLKSFKHRMSLKKHMFLHKSFKCGFCTALFQSEISLEQHLKIHKQSSNKNCVRDESFSYVAPIVDVVGSSNEAAGGENIIKTIDEDEVNENIKSVNKQMSNVEEDQVEVLLEQMHSEVQQEPFVKNNIVNKPNTCEQNTTLVMNEENLIDGSEINVSLVQPLATSVSDRVSAKNENNSSVYIVESQVNYNFEDKKHEKEEETNCYNILNVLDNNCTFEDSGYIEADRDTKPNTTNSEKKHIDVEFKTSKTDLSNLSESDGSKTVSRKIYMCSLCGLKTTSEAHIKRHFKCHIALERKTYKCHICERVLTTRSNLKRHISLHERCSSGEVECNMCNEVLTDRLHLKHHMEVKHPESYQCSFCDRRFDSKRACREHELTHPALQCNICQKMFLTEGRLKSHKLFMHSETGQSATRSKVFKCHICHKILTTYHNLKRHLRNHEKCSGAVNCALCNEELTDKLHLRQHVEEKHPENHQCSFCHRVFGSRKSCKSHEMTHPERFVYKCESCDKVFLTEARMKRHQDVMHRDPHCRICGKEISNMLKLLDHERRHERHKVMFPCGQCPKIFRTPSGLKYHMSVHTGKYAVYCEICGKGLHSEVVLEEHKATHTKEVRYTCEKCGRTFSSNSTYRMHRLWHDNPLPYKCNICDRKFKHTSILAVHKRRAHTGERPYQCPHCSQTFSVSSTLNKHIILHTKEYPYRCKLCEKGFTTRTKIARHMAKVHNDFEMLNSKKKTCEYKMVLHPSEISGGPRQSEEEDAGFISVEQMLQDEKVGEQEEDETQTATLQVLDPAQAAIFTIFQQDLPSSDFSLNEFDTVPK
ncbi:Protein glass [Gryllus bimaculatus]|nr:Protein glass [Gryllus bimaculatus]